MKIYIKKLHKDAIIPTYQTDGASGFDFHAIEDTMIHPSETKLLPTGLQISFPLGTELQIRPRSGLSLKTGLRIPNSPSTIDSDYLKEIGIILHNTAKTEILIRKGDRIAQGVLCPVLRGEIVESEEVYDIKSNRIGGFGSTGN